MHTSRRRFVLFGFPMALLTLPAAAQRAGRRRFPLPPGASRTALPGNQDPNVAPPAPDPRPSLKERQAEIKKQTARLYDLAAALKDEVEQTETADKLSLSLLRRAEEIEKVARRIKLLARG